MTDVQAVLERVTRVAGVRGALVASTADGLVVAEQLMDEVDGRAAAALAGSLVSRLMRTAGAAGRRPPSCVQLRADRGSILAAPGAHDTGTTAATARPRPGPRSPERPRSRRHR